MWRALSFCPLLLLTFLLKQLIRLTSNNFAPKTCCFSKSFCHFRQLGSIDFSKRLMDSIAVAFTCNERGVARGREASFHSFRAKLQNFHNLQTVSSADSRLKTIFISLETGLVLFVLTAWHENLEPRSSLRSLR